jgi:large subunit ribosomal protein L25
MRVGAGSEVHVSVPVTFVNHEASPGLRRGGILNIVRHSVDIICAVDAIPDRITVYLGGLDIGDSIHTDALAMPPGVRSALGSRDTTIASIATSSAVREEALAAAATPPTEEGAAATPAAEA